MKGQGETGRGGSQERERERQGGRRRERGREGKEGREKNKGVFTCLWNQQLAALSHNLRHMDIIRTTVSVCVCRRLGVLCATGCVCVCALKPMSLRCKLQKTVTFLWCSKVTVVPSNYPRTPPPPVWNMERPRVTLHEKLSLIGSSSVWGDTTLMCV